MNPWQHLLSFEMSSPVLGCNPNMILVVGDSRVRSLCFRTQHQQAFEPMAKLERVIELADAQLLQCPHSKFLFLIGLHCDFSHLEPWKGDPACSIMVTSNPDIASLLDIISSATGRWQKCYPELVVIWTLPYTPNFYVFNSIQVQQSSCKSALSVAQMNDFAKDYHRICSTLSNAWKTKLSHPPFQMVTLCPQMAIGRDNGLPFEGCTVDGLHPHPKTCQEFWVQAFSYAIKFKTSVFNGKYQWPESIFHKVDASSNILPRIGKSEPDMHSRVDKENPGTYFKAENSNQGSGSRIPTVVTGLSRIPHFKPSLVHNQQRELQISTLQTQVLSELPKSVISAKVLTPVKSEIAIPNESQLEDVLSELLEIDLPDVDELVLGRLGANEGSVETSAKREGFKLTSGAKTLSDELKEGGASETLKKSDVEKNELCKGELLQKENVECHLKESETLELKLSATESKVPSLKVIACKGIEKCRRSVPKVLCAKSEGFHSNEAKESEICEVKISKESENSVSKLTQNNEELYLKSTTDEAVKNILDNKEENDPSSKCKDISGQISPKAAQPCLDLSHSDGQTGKGNPLEEYYEVFSPVSEMALKELETEDVSDENDLDFLEENSSISSLSDWEFTGYGQEAVEEMTSSRRNEGCIASVAVNKGINPLPASRSSKISPLNKQFGKTPASDKVRLRRSVSKEVKIVQPRSGTRLSGGSRSRPVSIRRARSRSGVRSRSRPRLSQRGSNSGARMFRFRSSSRGPRVSLFTSPQRSLSPFPSLRRSHSPFLSSQRSGSPFLSYRRSQSPFPSSRRSRSPFLSSRRSRSPFLSSRRSRSPFLSSRRSQSPFLSSRRSRSPFPLSRISGSPFPSQRSRSPFLSCRRSGSPFPSSRRARSPFLLSRSGSPFSSSRRSRFQSFKRSGSPFPSSRRSRSSFPSSRRSRSPFPSSRRSRSPFPSSRRSKSPLPASRRSRSPFPSFKRSQSPFSFSLRSPLFPSSRRSSSPFSVFRRSPQFRSLRRSPSGSGVGRRSRSISGSRRRSIKRSESGSRSNLDLKLRPRQTESRSRSREISSRSKFRTEAFHHKCRKTSESVFRSRCRSGSKGGKKSQFQNRHASSKATHTDSRSQAKLRPESREVRTSRPKLASIALEQPSLSRDRILRKREGSKSPVILPEKGRGVGRGPSHEEREKNDGISYTLASIAKRMKKKKEKEEEEWRLGINIEEKVVFEETSLRALLGSKLYKEFCQEKERRYVQTEEEFQVYKTMPDMYPDYENVYEAFVAKLAMKSSDHTEEEKERLWMEFWASKFNRIKECEWGKRLSALVQEFKEKIVKIIPEATNTIDNKKVKNTLDLLMSLVPDLGVVGPSVSSIITAARECGSSTTDALRLFADPDNIFLLEMALKKLNPRQRALAEGPTKDLLEQAKAGVKQGILNMEAIAQASLGKDSVYVLNLIRTALTLEGLEPSNERINELFLRVCELHFDMAMREDHS